MSFRISRVIIRKSWTFQQSPLYGSKEPGLKNISNNKSERSTGARLGAGHALVHGFCFTDRRKWCLYENKKVALFPCHVERPGEERCYWKTAALITITCCVFPTQREKHDLQPLWLFLTLSHALSLSRSPESHVLRRWKNGAVGGITEGSLKVEQGIKEQSRR